MLGKSKIEFSLVQHIVVVAADWLLWHGCAGCKLKKSEQFIFAPLQFHLLLELFNNVEVDY